jgi:aspartate beta-hydroxylase
MAESPTPPSERVAPAGLERPPPTADLAEQIEVLLKAAEALVREGKPDDAERVYERVLEHAPHQIAALTFLALRAHERGDNERAAGFLLRATQTAPERPRLHQNLAVVRRAQGRAEAALAAIDRALALEPQAPLAHLHRGRILEDLGRGEEALSAYGRAFTLAPPLKSAPLDREPPAFRDLVGRARERLLSVRRRFLERVLVELEANLGAPLPERAHRFLRVFLGEEPRRHEDPLQKPEFLFYPGLRPRPWFERGEFPWIRAFEEPWEEIRREADALLEERRHRRPYVPSVMRGHPDWAGLAGSDTWGSIHLYRSGTPVPEVLARCPRTKATLDALPLASGANHAPEAFFSILEPGTELPPHHGLSNAKLTLHLGLRVPEGTGIEVGDETRTWTEGRSLIFDDSFRHRAWNRGREARLVLIVDVWHPELSDAERRLVSAMITTQDYYHRRYFAPPARPGGAEGATTDAAPSTPP